MRALTFAFVTLGVALLSGSAHAYPQWQFTSGAARCNLCHYAPGGGGLITGYARDAVGEDLSTFAGDGAFLHGAVELPSRLQLGGDFRGAFVAKDVQDPNGSTRAIFPMQADLLGRVAITEAFSAYASVGLRARVRKDDDIVPDTNYQPIHVSRLISREHWVMWRPGTRGPYARVGRFYAPFGLRLAEHITYVRRDLGFNQLEETYNLSGGFVDERWDLHGTLFAPDFVRGIGSEEGGLAAYAERRVLDDKGAVALQTRVAIGRGVNRWIGGFVGKYHLATIRTLFLAEGNLVHHSPDDVESRQGFVGTAGFAVLPLRGLILTALAERNQVDLRVRDAVWNAATGLVNWFPYPHVEVQVMGRLQFPGGGDVAPSFLFQLHYYL